MHRLFDLLEDGQTAFAPLDHDLIVGDILGKGVLHPIEVSDEHQIVHRAILAVLVGQQKNVKAAKKRQVLTLDKLLRLTAQEAAKQGQSLLL